MVNRAITAALLATTALVLSSEAQAQCTGQGPANRVCGTPTAASGLPTLRALVPNDLVVGSGGGTVNFLRADGVWAVPPGKSPGTPLNSVQYNSPLGTFAGSAEMTFNGTSLAIGNFAASD